MLEAIHFLLQDAGVRAELSRAWQESNPGISGGHEEGGFVVEEPDGSKIVLRWPHGNQDEIEVPTHTGCQAQGMRILASFHTHPNTGIDYAQEPSEDDIEAVSEDEDLNGELYLGEIVIASKLTYLVSQGGLVSELGPTQLLLALSR